MKTLLVSGLSGVLFGLGLAMGGMTDPGVVLGFLDVTGAWNPRLVFVLAGAVVTTAIGYQLVLRRRQPLLAATFQLPGKTRIDRRLLLGAVVFGLGWGTAGYCPGPALASIGALYPATLGFVVTMIVGWWLGGRLMKTQTSSVEPE
jgi:uncharacterized membrane protein YedE/YeeE